MDKLPESDQEFLATVGDVLLPKDFARKMQEKMDREYIARVGEEEFKAVREHQAKCRTWKAQCPFYQRTFKTVPPYVGKKKWKLWLNGEERPNGEMMTAFAEALGRTRESLEREWSVWLKRRPVFRSTNTRMAAMAEWVQRNPLIRHLTNLTGFTGFTGFTNEEWHLLSGVIRPTDEQLRALAEKAGYTGDIIRDFDAWLAEKP